MSNLNKLIVGEEIWSNISASIIIFIIVVFGQIIAPNVVVNIGVALIILGITFLVLTGIDISKRL